MRQGLKTCAYALTLSMMASALAAQNPLVDAAQSTGSRESLEKLVNAIQFGIATSPAFELLPGKPSDVVSLLTPSDFGGQIKSWTDGTHLLAGAAVDIRPFALYAGSLADYEKYPARQVAWRTVLSAGTAAATNKPKDVLASIGLRIPLVDQGDLRGDKAYQDELAKRYGAAFDAEIKRAWPSGPPPGITSRDPVLHAADSSATAAVREYRTAHVAERWNATKLDLGVAGSVRTLNGIATKDSVRANSGGVWLAAGVPVPGIPAQLSASGKWMGSQRDTVIQETSRLVYGARLRLLSTTGWSMSAEWSGTNVWHSGKRDLDENWNHYGVLIEIPSPVGGGWIGIGYGGDTPHGVEATRQIGLQYALYENRILKR